MDNQKLEERCRVLEFVQSTLRAIAALYAIWRYPDYVKATLKAISSLFHAEPLANVRDFMHQLSENPEPLAANTL